jgi:hypothetical protein
MSRSATRFLLTFLMYFGVVIFLYPYVTGRLSNGILMLIGGASMAVICGLSRCFLTEGDCADTHITKPAP